MFSLIVTVISIALVALLGVSTIYYGGESLSEGQVNARAATIATQGLQLSAAMTLFNQDKGRYPNSLQELVTEKYLSAIPSSITGAGWEQVQAAAPMVWLVHQVSEPECLAFNKLAMQTARIMTDARPGPEGQCFGDAANYTVIFGNTLAAQSFVDTVNAAAATLGDTSIRASLTGGTEAVSTASAPTATSIVTTFVLTQEWVNEGGYLSRFTGTFSRYCPAGGTVVTSDYGTLDVNGAYLPMDGNPGDLQWIATDGGFQLHRAPLAPGATSPQVVLCLPANDSDAARYTDLIASLGITPNFGTPGGGIEATDPFSEPYVSLTFNDWGQDRLLQNGTLTLAGQRWGIYSVQTWTTTSDPVERLTAVGNAFKVTKLGDIESTEPFRFTTDIGSGSTHIGRLVWGSSDLCSPDLDPSLRPVNRCQSK